MLWSFGLAADAIFGWMGGVEIEKNGVAVI